MQSLKIEDIERVLRDVGMPEITSLGNGMYNLFGRVLASEEFLLELNKEFKKLFLTH